MKTKQDLSETYTDEQLERITQALDDLVKKTQKQRQTYILSKEAEKAFISTLIKKDK